MTNISKRQLKPEHLDKLFTQLSNVSLLLTEDTASDFFDDLLGTEEKVMLAKRLAAIAMFIEGNSSYRVWQLLKISPATAGKIRLNYKSGKYAKIEGVLRLNKDTYVQFWKTLEIILQAGMPTKGRGRWKSVFNQQD